MKDWASCGNDIEHWSELLKEQHYIVAENETGMIVGFASVNDYGYMNALFVHKNFQRNGIATSLYKCVETYARETGVEALTSEVSITAKPFFENKGFKSMHNGKGKQTD